MLERQDNCYFHPTSVSKKRSPDDAVCAVFPSDKQD